MLLHIMSYINVKTYNCTYMEYPVGEEIIKKVYVWESSHAIIFPHVVEKFVCFGTEISA